RVSSHRSTMNSFPSREADTSRLLHRSLKLMPIIGIGDGIARRYPGRFCISSIGVTSDWHRFDRPLRSVLVPLQRSLWGAEWRIRALALPSALPSDVLRHAR